MIVPIIHCLRNQMQPELLTVRLVNRQFKLLEAQVRMWNESEKYEGKGMREETMKLTYEKDDQKWIV